MIEDFKEPVQADELFKKLNLKFDYEEIMNKKIIDVYFKCNK